MEDEIVNMSLLAKWMLYLANEKRIVLNQTKLQKLLFVLYGVCLVITDREFQTDEKPRVWPSGPVFQGVRSNIDIQNKERPQEDIAEYLKTAINKVLDVFGKRTILELIKWVKQIDGPWFKMQKNAELGSEISDDLVYDFFRNNVVKIRNQGEEV